MPSFPATPKTGTDFMFSRMSAGKNYLELWPAWSDQAAPGGDRDRFELAVSTEFG
jgi:hypothetical protein